MSKQQRKILGYLDSVTENYITGWLLDVADHNHSLQIELFVGDQYLGQWFSGYFREDLYLAGFGNGCHGFKVFLTEPISPADVQSSMEIFVPGSKPIWLHVKDGEFFPNEAMGLRKQPEFKKFYDKILTYICNINERAIENTNSIFTEQPHTLTNWIANRHVNGGGSIFDDFDFTNFIQRKHNKTENKIDFYEWFTSEYLSYYPRDVAVPLTPKDIRSILELVEKKRQPVRTTYKKTTARLERFLRNIPFRKTTQAYWWIAEGGRGLRLPEICANPQDVALLRRRIRFLGTSLPVNRFIIIFSMKHLGVNPLRLLFHSTRVDVYIWIFLLSCQNFFLLRYLPEGGLRELISELKESPRKMARTLTRVQSWGKSVPNTTILDVFTVILERLDSHILVDKQVKSNSNFNVNLQIIGPFSKVLGLSESCRRLGDLIEKNVDANCTLTDYHIGNLSTSLEVEYNKEIKKSDINIIHINAEEVPEFYIRYGEKIKNSYNILYPYWELETLSSIHLPGIKLVDEIWAASDFITQSFKKAKANVFRIGLPPASFKRQHPTERNSQEFVFLSTFDALSWPQRKNAAAVIEAFMHAFEIEVPVKLLVKCQNTDKINQPEQKAEWGKIVDRCQSDSRIRLLDQTIDRSEQEHLLSSSSCLVSLHRAEGLGIDILDCLANGIPVIATAYSGNMDICNHNNCWLVDYSMVAVNKSNYAFVEEGHVWAEVDLQSAVKAFRGVFFEPIAREQKAARAIHDVAAIASTDAIASKIIERLRYLSKLQKP
ncbi:glycosyltransferase [Rhizobium hainanense]|uniref:Glycosyltransferase involved in cell wall bisynthesis n=1 Tax=Rhizobium hainanense TaxID=52131 RepID=A0A1C3W261_9HYPH|nr:glycosyltransferase [Rhizobium hainanense]SCB33975.1 Glycosyltransferase involved in cell wall bisynthesis [Rhizobium hainanense]